MMASSMSVTQVKLTTNGLNDSDSAGADSDDPEMQAEIQYAKEHNLSATNSHVIAAKMRMKKSKSMEVSIPTANLVNGIINVPRPQKNQRKSRAGKGRGLPKKGGGGGKGIWGKPGRVYDELEFMDSRDPNYDSDTQGKVTYSTLSPEMSESDLPKYVDPIIEEFITNGNLKDASDCLGELNLNGPARVAIVRRLLSHALDHKPVARELTSSLLSELVHKRIFSSVDMRNGFFHLLKSDLPELSIDYPGASEIVGNFAARAIADEALTTTFIKDNKESFSSAEAGEALERAELMLVQKHRLDNIWGVGGGHRPVKFLVTKIKELLEEYLNSRDTKEAERCVRELDVPHFNHEIVFQAGVMVIESMHERTAEALCGLLKSFYESGLLTQNCTVSGFERLFAAMPDISLDVPPAYTLLERWANKCEAAGVIPAETSRRVPQRGRKRFVSEGDGGRLTVIDAHPFI